MELELNNRELAAMIWLGIVLLLMLSRADFRRSLADIAKSFLEPEILFTLGIFIAWIVGGLWLAGQIGLWEDSLVNEAVYWFFATGFVLYFSVGQVSERPGFFKQTASKALTLALLAEVLINLVVMPLWVELVFLPMITCLVAIQAFARGKPELALVKKRSDWVLSLIGLALFTFVAGSLIADPDQLDWAHLARLLVLPIWLTLLSLPFIYLFGLWTAYEKAFNRIGRFAKKKKHERQAKLAMIKSFHLRARRVGEFNGRWQRQLVEAVAAGEPKRVMSEFHQQRQAA